MAALSIIDWSKIDLEEVKERWAKKRKELEEEEEKKRVDNEWRRVGKMRAVEEKKKEKEWK